jgi:hypothetical protein
MGAAEEMAVDLYSVADDFTFAVFAAGSYCLDCAFEAVEDVFGATGNYFETLVVVVSANFTFGHGIILSERLVDGWGDYWCCLL